jgi:hypothetical protein
LPIVDISEAADADKNKRITIEELLRGAPDGTAAAPSIAFESDPDSGLYSTGANGLALATGGTGRLFVHSNGLVGIGTSDPNTTLHLGTTPADAGSAGVIGFGDISNYRVAEVEGYREGASFAGSLIFRTQTAGGISSAGAERLRITSTGQLSHIGGGTSGSPAVSFNGSAPSNSLVVDSSGRLGVGTNSPSVNLDVQATASAVASVSSTAASNYGQLRLQTNQQFVIGYGSTHSSQPNELSLKNNIGDLTFYTSVQERVRIDSSGNVGIGTTSPASLLHLQGDSNTQLRLTSAASGISRIIFGDTSDTARCAIQVDSSDSDLVFQGYNMAERARIDSSGRLLVGTSTARSNYLLQSTGTGSNEPGLTLWRANEAFGFINGSGGGTIEFAAAPASGVYGVGATIKMAGDGTWGSDDYPGRLVFSTTADGAPSPTERMTIKSNGNVGIGTTSPSTKLHIADAAAPEFRIVDTTNNCTGFMRPVDSSLRFGTGSNHPLQFFVNSSERARIDSSGRLLVGTASAGTNYRVTSTNYTPQTQIVSDTVFGLAVNRTNGDANISIARSNAVIADDTIGRLIFNATDGSNLLAAAHITAQVDGTPGASDMPGRLVFSTTADGASSPTERMRIDSTGQVRIATNGAANLLFVHNAQNTTDQVHCTIRGGTYTTSDTTTKFIVFQRNDGTEVGSVSRNGTTTVAFNTSSDYRLKENVVKLVEASQKLAQLNPVTFNFIGDERTVGGFIAHEVQSVIPEAITGEKDAVDDDGNPVYQGIDQSKLVPLLTAALQEALAEIESLKARVTALEP